MHTVIIYRCIGKINNRVTYRIAVVATDYNHAIHTCKVWERDNHPGSMATWDAQRQETTLGPLYMETELVG